VVEEKRRTEKGATHRQPAGGQESDTKREEEKEGEKSCRSNIRGRRRKQDQRPWKKMAEVEERFRGCLGPALLQYSLSTCYPSSTIIRFYPRSGSSRVYR